MIKRSALFVSIIATLAIYLACSNSISGAPNAEKIKGDLIGHTLLNFDGHGNVWGFSSLSEIEKVDIRETVPSSHLIEYKVNVGLKDMNTGERYSGDLLIQYRREGSEWKIINIVNKVVFKKIT
jgi:hypothetical protein